MASRHYKQFLFSNNVGLTFIEGSFRVGVAGAVVRNSFVGDGLWASSASAVSRASGAGVYQMQFDGNYGRCLGGFFDIIPGPSSAGVRDGSGNIILGKPYQIVNVGSSGSEEGMLNTDWHQLGVPTNLTPVRGMVFVPSSAQSNASSAGIGAGSGVLQLLGGTNLSHVEILPGMNTQLAPTSALYGTGQTREVAGATVWIQTRLSSSGAPVNATCGTTIRFGLFFRNSGLLNQGETAQTATAAPND